MAGDVALPVEAANNLLRSQRPFFKTNIKSSPAHRAGGLQSHCRGGAQHSRRPQLLRHADRSFIRYVNCWYHLLRDHVALGQNLLWRHQRTFCVPGCFLDEGAVPTSRSYMELQCTGHPSRPVGAIRNTHAAMGIPFRAPMLGGSHRKSRFRPGMIAVAMLTKFGLR